MHDKVSIIIPTYNSEKYIVEAVQSALHQEGVCTEVIIVDDGSTDTTYQILHKQGLLSYIKYIYQKNQGPSVARNVGLSKAKGDYCCFLDSDDILANNFCSQLITLLKQYQENVIYCDYIRFTDGTDDRKIIHHKKNLSGDILGQLILANLTPTDSVLFKRSCIETLRFDETTKYYEDWLFWTHLAIKNKFIHCSRPLVQIRVRNNSLSTDREAMARHGYMVREKLIPIVENNRFRIRPKQYRSFYYEVSKDLLKQGKLSLSTHHFLKVASITDITKIVRFVIAYIKSYLTSKFVNRTRISSIS